MRAQVAERHSNTNYISLTSANTSGSTNLSGYVCGSTNRNFQVLS